MPSYKNDTIINYNIKDVFRVFHKTAKRDFPKFKESTAIGTKVTRNVGAYSSKKGEMHIEISDYKRDEVYEITSYKKGVSFKSRYETQVIDENNTKVTLIEEDDTKGLFKAMNYILGILFVKRKASNRFKVVIKELEYEIERSLNNMGSKKKQHSFTP